jgi:hypothetical protein
MSHSDDYPGCPGRAALLAGDSSREEPGALAAHAGICAGGKEKSSSYRDPARLTEIMGHLDAAFIGSICPGIDLALSKHERLKQMWSAKPTRSFVP